jgi:hypothetical protein
VLSVNGLSSKLYTVNRNNKEFQAELIKPTLLMQRFLVRYIVAVFAATVSFHFISSYFSEDLLLVDNRVSIASHCGQDSRGVGVPVPVGAEFLLSTSSLSILGPTQPPIQRKLGSFPRGPAAGA